MSQCLLGAIIDIYLLCKKETPKAKPEYFGRLAPLMKWNTLKLFPLFQIIARFMLVEAKRLNANEEKEIPQRLQKQLEQLLKTETGREDFLIQEGNDHDVEAALIGNISKDNNALVGKSARERKTYLIKAAKALLYIPIAAKLIQAELIELKLIETFLEAAPQFCFQMSIILRTGTLELAIKM